jgi:hypothetical protein
MNKNILCFIPLSLIVASSGLWSQEPANVAGCVKRPATERCVDNSGGGTTPFVNVTANGWAVVPTNVCVTAGDTLEIRFQGNAPTLNTMTTRPYGNSESWLIGSNSSNKSTITLTVSAGHETGDFFDYAIFSESDGCVDPRVTYN